MNSSTMHKPAFTDLEFTPQEMEIICQLNLDANERAQVFKRKLAGKLHRAYQSGSHIGPIYCAKDRWKAFKFNQVAQNCQLEMEEKHLLRTQHVYLASRNINDIRLLTLRTLRVLKMTGITMFNCASQVVSILGLSYFARLIFDLGVIIKHGLKADNDYEKTLSFNQRCRLAWERDGRKFRMRNDAVWFGVNATSFVLSFFTFGTAHLISNSIQTSAFLFDVGNEAGEFAEIKKQTHLLNKLTTHVADLKDKNHHLLTQINERSDVIKSTMTSKYKAKLACHDTEVQELSKLKSQYQKNQQNIHKYECISTALEAKKASDKRLRTYIVVASAVLFLSMTAFFFWPGHLLAMTIIASLALASGSIGNGFGRRVYDSVKGFFGSKPSAAQIAPAATSHATRFFQPTSKVAIEDKKLCYQRVI